MYIRIKHISLLIYFATTILLTMLLSGCSGSATSKKIKHLEQTETDSLSVVSKKPPSSYNDTLVVRGNAAVFYIADSMQLEKIRAITQKLVYESNNHDCFYQMRNARLVLKKYWPQVQIVETSRARYLLFVNADKTNTCIDLNFKNDQCGVFLFADSKAPKLADMTNIDTELGFYFPH